MSNTDADWAALMAESVAAVQNKRERLADTEEAYRQECVSEIVVLEKYIAEHLAVEGAIVRAIILSAHSQGIDIKQVLSGESNAELTAAVRSLTDAGARLYRSGVQDFGEIRKRGENYHPAPTKVGYRWRL